MGILGVIGGVVGVFGKRRGGMGGWWRGAWALLRGERGGTGRG
jgi:hypothetical protein